MFLRTTRARTGSSLHRRRGPALVAVALVYTLATGCDTIFEVENPNNIKGEDLELPQAQTALVNGSFGTVARGITASRGLYSPATDEITFIGSRDAWRQLDFGFLEDTQNEFLNVAFPVIAQGRWMADEAIKQLERFRSEGTLRSEEDLARAYLFGAIAYINIADTFDDFVLSDRGQEAPPIGEGEMNVLYNQAIEYLSSGLEIANRTGNQELGTRILAVRSRAHHALGIWQLLNPAGSTPASPLVASAAAAQDARAFFALNADPNWRYVITLTEPDMVPGGEIALGNNMNSRAELQFEVVARDPSDPATITGVTLLDPIDDVPDPFVTAEIAAFKDSFIFTSQTIVSAREMHLILAENALANGNTAEAVERLNTVRALDGLTAFDPAVHTGVTPTQMLEHERRRNLFLQNKRLADMYRFGSESVLWAPDSPAASTPGTFFPIPMVERQSNCFIAGTC